MSTLKVHVSNVQLYNILSLLYMRRMLYSAFKIIYLYTINRSEIRNKILTDDEQTQSQQ